MAPKGKGTASSSSPDGVKKKKKKPKDGDDDDEPVAKEAIVVEEDNVTGAETPPDAPIKPENCKVVGLEDALTVKVPAEFRIEAYDESGRRRLQGGDIFFIAIRGASRVRARVTDDDSGEYLVQWKPVVSGHYAVSVSLFGISLPGSPFNLYVNDPSPYAPNCEVSGQALNYITARNSWSFDIHFRNRSGEVAQAVDLDVYVEGLPEEPEAAALFVKAWELATRLSPPPPEHDETAVQQQQQMAEADAAAAAASGGMARAKAKRKGSTTMASSAAEPAAAPPKPAAAQDPSSMIPVAAEPEDAVVDPAAAEPEEAVDSSPAPAPAEAGSPVSGDGGMSSGDELQPWADATRQRALRIRVGKKPLIVRAAPQLDSEQIGQLRPSQTVTVLEERIADGYVRACVTFEQLPIPFATGEEWPDLESSRLGSTRARSSSPVLREPPGPLSPPSPGSPQDYLSIGSPSSPPLSPERGGPTERANKGKLLTGWVTLKKHGKKLVTSRLKLETTQRQHYLQQWKRRQLNDKLGADVKSELTIDPSGVGFAFGGVHPGYLHSKGRLLEKHTVSYSVGKVGRYLLHVRLRQQALPVPGSPFALIVSPGAADHRSTQLETRSQPLRGAVGLAADDGCKLVLKTADVMGNTCIKGGAAVTTGCDTDAVQSDCTDLQDGTYLLQWRSKQSGIFEAKVLIGSKPVRGSPVKFQITSTIPELNRCELNGEGTRAAIAGEPATVSIQFYDSFGNIALPGDEYRLGVGLASDKKKLQDVKELPCESRRWRSDDSGEYLLTFKANAAGNTELHVWCDPDEKGERIALPGSPFNLHVVAGAPSAGKSQVSGWTKAVKDDKAGDARKQGAAGASGSGDAEAKDLKITAGDQVITKPMILDEFGNQAQLTDGTLQANLVKPDGAEIPLSLITTHVKGSTLPNYELKTDTSMAGEHAVHIRLNGEAISGSPVTFTVNGGGPDPERSVLIPPEASEKLVPDYDQPTIVVLKTFDKFGNACTFGGLIPQGRLTIVKQGAADNTLLMANNHQVTVEDLKDGTYAVKVQIKIAATVKLTVNMDKNLPGQGGELPPVQLTFVAGIAPVQTATEEDHAVGAGPPDEAPSVKEAAPVGHGRRNSFSAQGRRGSTAFAKDGMAAAPAVSFVKEGVGAA